MSKRARFLLSAALIAVAVSVVAEQPTGPGDEASQVNYSVGYRIGADFRRQGESLRAEAVVQGIRDALSGTQSLMTTEEMQSALTELGRRALERRKGEGPGAAP